MAYSPQYQAMAVGAVRALVGTENIHLTEAISRVARQMGLDSDLLDAWVRDSTPYTAREDQRGLKRRGASRIHSSQDHAANTPADGPGDNLHPCAWHRIRRPRSTPHIQACRRHAGSRGERSRLETNRAATAQ